MMLFITGYYYETIITLFVLLTVFILRLTLAHLIRKYARTTHILEHRTNLAIKYISIFISVIGFTVIFIVWGVKAENIFATVTGVITVIGIAFFAQWSVLSNITAGMILLFSFPFKIGDIIRIHDKDFPLEAEIEDIRAFMTLLRTKDGEMISYPNNLLLQKAVSVIKNFTEPAEFTD